VELGCPAVAPFVYSRHVDAQPHGSFQQLQREDAALREFVRLRRAIRKANGDRERAIAPLTIAPGSLVLDTTALTSEEQVERVLSIVRARHPEVGTAQPG